MGPFILGILVGWLAEWLFFTFWVKNGSKSSSSDCSELLAELRTKNSEIDSLKASLAKAEKDNEANKTESVASLLSSTSVSKTKKATATPATKKAPAKKRATSTKTSPATKSASTAKKPAAKKAAPKKSSPQKAAPKKAATRKSTAKKTTTGDDLTKLSGIGPSMAATMSELGITSYKKLAAMDDDILRDMLEASGARMNNNKEAMDSWNEQALLADQGDFEGLKKLQEDLKK